MELTLTSRYEIVLPHPLPDGVTNEMIAKALRAGDYEKCGYFDHESVEIFVEVEGSDVTIEAELSLDADEVQVDGAIEG